MAAVLHDYSELKTFALEDVKLTGKRIGSACSYVEEGRIPGALCAVKRVDDIFQDRSEEPEAEFQCVVDNFVQKCRLLSTLRHPHIVQYLGISVVPSSRLPALVMERMLTNLQDVLATRPNIPLALKHSFLYDVAKGINYLHTRSPPLVHLNLSTKNVLLTTDMTDKVGGLEKARTVSSQSVAAVIKPHDVSLYMPPEVLKSDFRCDKTIDIFSLGVVTLFTLTQKVSAQVSQDQHRKRVALPELEWQSEYKQQICSQFREDHPLVLMIGQCLERFSHKRPTIQRVMQLLKQARVEINDAECHMDRLELVRAVKNASSEIESKDREIEALKVRMQSKEEEHHRESVASKDEIFHLKHRIETAELESTKLVDDLIKKNKSQQIQIEQLKNPALVSYSVKSKGIVR